MSELLEYGLDLSQNVLGLIGSIIRGEIVVKLLEILFRIRSQ